MRRPTWGRGARARLPPAARLDILVLVAALSALVGIGWLAEPLLAAICIGLQLAVGGFGGTALIGPARAGAGMARYLTLPLASVSITLPGRVIGPDPVILLLLPIAAFALWLVLRMELAYARGERPKAALDVGLGLILLGFAAGIPEVVGPEAWPPPLALIGLLVLVLGLRAAEGRGSLGGDALGQAVLHGLAVVQLAAALFLLELPGFVAPAVIALGFYGWSGAADALQGGASARTVALEFGALGVLGLIVALLVYSR